jgi:peptidyl-Lys metalloendopeptidase
MRLFFAVSILGMLTLGASASAQTYRSCTKSEQVIVGKALTDSKRLALIAAANVGNNAIFEVWFGKYTPEHGELVRRNLKSVVSAIRTGAVTATCTNVAFDGCEPGTYAWVYPDQPFEIHFCPPFFDMPSLSEYRAGEDIDDNGTREGTVIHEMSHFYRTAETEDICYARDVCSRLALRRPQDVVQNADSYQYFAEDVSYFYAINPNGQILSASEGAN